MKHVASGDVAAVIENVPTTGVNVAYNRLTIKVNEGGDLLYNYLTSEHNSAFGNHNVLTKWGRTELMLKDDMEKLLPLRMVTDINGVCAAPDTFANNNYYYIHDFNVKFERALRWAFTTVELTDDQHLQKAPFDFATKNTRNSVYRGLFDHAYATGDGYGNLVSYMVPNNGQYSRHNPWMQAAYYNVFPADMYTDPVTREIYDNDPTSAWFDEYTGIDYRHVEVSKDGGATWTPIDNDYKLTGDHDNRYFDIKLKDDYTWEARWQGDHTPINQTLHFRVPVVNFASAILGFAPDTNGDYWMGYRNGYAKVKGYAVFKINPRN